MEEKELLEKANSCFENKQYDSVISLIEQNKGIIQKHYHALNILYIKSLYEKKNYQEALSLVKEELSMPYIPMEYEDIYHNIYRDVVNEMTEQVEFPKMSEEDIKSVLTSRPVKEETMFTIASLKEKNIRNYLPELKLFMSDPSVDNVYKMVALLILKSQEVSTEIDFISKTGSKKINPVEYTLPLEECGVVDKACEIINECNKDYNFKECAKAITTGMIVSLLPLEIEKDDVTELAAFGYYKACQMLSISITLEKLLEIFPTINLDKINYLLSIEM
ncbi:MAG: DUF3196 domain-containing protein [Erysipelotrichaceae bacterium]|nr:DUF3196 domain-containing protein [Erysipelotrichaceae bacterium]